MIKPQFEVGRSRVGKKGVVRDPQDHSQAIYQVLHNAYILGWFCCGLTASPITGPAGNKEYLAWLRCDRGSQDYSLDIITQLTKGNLSELVR